MATIDSNRSIALDDTGCYIVFITITVMCLWASRIVLIRTATTAIDVTTEFIICTTIDARICNTYPTAMDGNRGIMEGMSVLTTAIYRTLNLRAVSCIVRFTNHNLRIIYPCHVVLDSTRCCDITSRGTEYHTIIMSVSTNSTTIDGDGSLTCVFCSKASDDITVVIVSTYRTVCTTTIYIMEDVTTLYNDFCIFLNDTYLYSSTATKTAAIDVTVCSTTFAFCSDCTAVNNDVRTTIYSCQ